MQKKKLYFSHMKFKQILFASVFLAAFSPTSAQEVDNNRRLTITLKNGSVYHGTMDYDDGREMKFTTDEFGLLIIKKQELRRLDLIKSKEPEKVEDSASSDVMAYYATFKEGPFSTRYGITTNGFAIKKGENYGLISLYGPEIHFAVTDRLNVGYMTTWAASPMALSIKYSFTTDKSPVQVSAGSLLMSSGFFQSMRGYGTLTFGNLTFGNRSANVNLSGGYFYWKSGKQVIAPGNYEVNSTSSIAAADPTMPQSSFDFFQQSSQLRYGNNGRRINENIVGSNDITTGYATQGPVIGLSGIFPLGEKASFVFESMLGLFVTRREYIADGVYTGSELVVINGGTMYNHLYNVEVSTRDYGATMIYVSPGVRFQSKDDFAWQLSLASTSLSSEVNNKTQSFPIPTFSLFKKF